MFRRIELMYCRGHTKYVPFNDETWPWEQDLWPSYETSYNKDNANTTSWPIPTIIGLRP